MGTLSRVWRVFQTVFLDKTWHLRLKLTFKVIVVGCGTPGNTENQKLCGSPVPLRTWAHVRGAADAQI